MLARHRVIYWLGVELVSRTWCTSAWNEEKTRLSSSVVDVAAVASSVAGSGGGRCNGGGVSADDARAWSGVMR